MKTAFESYGRETSERRFIKDGRALEVRLLSDISRLYMEHYHFIQQSRRRETADFVGKSKKLVDEVLNAIEKQNCYVCDETGHDMEQALMVPTLSSSMRFPRLSLTSLT